MEKGEGVYDGGNSVRILRESRLDGGAEPKRIGQCVVRRDAARPVYGPDRRYKLS